MGIGYGAKEFTRRPGNTAEPPRESFKACLA
jgi:hypothetical protein